jgi:uncharacterized protein YggU (UPF0235/DUF167 family)
LSAAAASPLALSLHRSRDGVTLPVRLTPKSSRDEKSPALRIMAVPEAGRANEALETLIAKWLGLPPSTVTVAHGAKSRLKQVAVMGDAEALSRLIAQRLTELA